MGGSVSTTYDDSGQPPPFTRLHQGGTLTPPHSLQHQSRSNQLSSLLVLLVPLRVGCTEGVVHTTACLEGNLSFYSVSYILKSYTVARTQVYETTELLVPNLVQFEGNVDV